MDDLTFVAEVDGFHHHYEYFFSEVLVQLLLSNHHYIPQIVDHLIHDQNEKVFILATAFKSHDVWMVKKLHQLFLKLG